MLEREYLDWCKKHALRFGFVSEGDCAMLREWFEVFSLDAAGDLAEASGRLPRRPRRPDTRGEHRCPTLK